MVTENEQVQAVILDKSGKNSFGICIVSGEVKDSPYSKTSGIFIKGIVPESPAQLCGKLRVGDRILFLNDRDVQNASEQTVINLIKDAGPKINLKIQTFSHKKNETRKSIIKKDHHNFNNKQYGTSIRYKSNNLDDGMMNNNNNESNRNANDLNSYGDDEFDIDEEDTRDMMGKMLTKAGFEIDRSSAGNAKLSRSEREADTETEDEFGYTMKKIKKRYANLNNVFKTEITRPPNADLGLALAGHRDRQKMACFVAGINPEGLVAKSELKSGDEILEVNGHVLQNRSHLNASVVFKNLPGEKLVFIAYRRGPKEEGISVKPITKFAPLVDETEYLFTTYKNVRAVQIQKVGSSLGIMIIEGKHVEVGNGIFISDLQADSNAVQAGLKVGEMILAINKDVIVDTNYDTAAGLLKRAEGIVRLVVCSLKSEEQVKAEKEAEEKKLEAPKEPEKPADPATDEIKPNKKTLIEIKVDKKPLGCVVVGGRNNYVKTGCVITNIYPGGAFAADNRLQIFDQIISLNGNAIDCAAMENTTHKVHQMFHLSYDKVTLLVWRNDPPETEKINIEFIKKPGKELGLSLAPNSKGVTITEITSAGYTDIDNKLQRGDIITKFNGEVFENAIFQVCYSLIKSANGKITMEILRPKPTARTA